MRFLFFALLLAACGANETRIVYVERGEAPEEDTDTTTKEIATEEEAKLVGFSCATFEIPAPGTWNDYDADSKALIAATSACFKGTPTPQKSIEIDAGTYHSSVTDGEWIHLPYVWAEAITNGSTKTVQAVLVVEKNFNCSQDPSYPQNPEPMEKDISPGGPSGGGIATKACSVKNGEKYMKRQLFLRSNYPDEKVLLAEWVVRFKVAP